VAALLVVNTLILRIEGVGRLLQMIADARASAGRIWEVLDAEPDIVSGAAALPGPIGFRFSQVSAAPLGDGADVLHDLSFIVRPGEVVALGPRGRESILTALLPRLIDAAARWRLIGSGRLAGCAWAGSGRLAAAGACSAAGKLPVFRHAGTEFAPVRAPGR
jgi:ATP-binding cassette subfamily B protein